MSRWPVLTDQGCNSCTRNVASSSAKYWSFVPNWKPIGKGLRIGPIAPHRRHNRILFFRKWLKIKPRGSRTCKPNSVRNKNAAGRSFLWATHYCVAQATYPEVAAHRAGTLPAEAEIPPYLVLLRVGFALPGTLLRRRCALTAPFHPYLNLAAQAVCFLWHFPSNRLEPAVPDVIRHTALRSSDFPPVLRRATVRSGCQQIHYRAGAIAGRW